VNTRLKPGRIRELHWHKEAEWAYMLAGLFAKYGVFTNCNRSRRGRREVRNTLAGLV
jgi:oxalate decarboxylase/phosphoglucose isomerase-like protein (cupin superfamily)